MQFITTWGESVGHWEGDTLVIEDPETLTSPWHAKVAYVREKQLDRLVHDDFTNDRSEPEGGVFTIEPSKK